MIRKEQLLKIQELKLSGLINTMTDSQFSAYVQTLNRFVDSFPQLADSLTKALDAGQYGMLGKGLSELYELLKKIHADGLAADCLRQSKSLLGAAQAEIDEDAVESFVENLIQGTSALSIEVQMAAHRTAAPPPPQQPKPQPQAAPSPAWKGSSRGTVLAVDNAVMFLNTLKKLLSSAPYDLHCVTSGEEALDFLRKNRADAILLDVEMPGMDGYELARRIKRDGHRAPIIFITANSTREYVDRAIEVGSAGLMMKPLRVNQLLDKLKENM